ncbi:MAG: hypothetical protein DRQ51_09220, partial [Gammaproteobacteria bacterium]
MKKPQQQPQINIEKLIIHGKEQGFLTYNEIYDHLPDDISES